MSTYVKGMKVVDGKLVRTKRKKDASAEIRERKSKKARVVSKKTASTFNTIGKTK